MYPQARSFSVPELLVYQSGDGIKLYEKWFQQKIPPRGLNLNVPLGPELKNEFAKPSDSPDPDSYKAM